jgi:hypothetical protein
VERILSRFILNIAVAQGADDRLNCRATWYNEDVPAEMLITQMRALVRQLENEHFDRFDRQTPGARPK